MSSNDMERTNAVRRLYTNQLEESAHLMRHVNPLCVDDIFQNFLSKYEVTSFNLVDPAEYITLIWSPTQNGKSRETIALVWILFYKYRKLTYMFLHSNGAEYKDLYLKAAEFNDELQKFYEERIEEGRPDWKDEDPMNYYVGVLPLDENRTIMSSDFIRSDHQFPRTLKCTTRARLLTASNVDSAVKRDLSLIIEHAGVDKNNQYNFVFIIDEAQNLHRTLLQNGLVLERNWFKNPVPSFAKAVAQYHIDLGRRNIRLPKRKR
jgi:hypothetical protein